MSSYVFFGPTPSMEKTSVLLETRSSATALLETGCGKLGQLASAAEDRTGTVSIAIKTTIFTMFSAQFDKRH